MLVKVMLFYFMYIQKPMTDEHHEQTALFALKLSYHLMRLASIHVS